jgi:hypothetical protein
MTGLLSRKGCTANTVDLCLLHISILLWWWLFYTPFRNPILIFFFFFLSALWLGSLFFWRYTDRSYSLGRAVMVQATNCQEAHHVHCRQCLLRQALLSPFQILHGVINLDWAVTRHQCLPCCLAYTIQFRTLCVFVSEYRRWTPLLFFILPSFYSFAIYLARSAFWCSYYFWHTWWYLLYWIAKK